MAGAVRGYFAQKFILCKYEFTGRSRRRRSSSGSGPRRRSSCDGVGSTALDVHCFMLRASYFPRCGAAVLRHHNVA